MSSNVREILEPDEGNRMDPDGGLSYAWDPLDFDYGVENLENELDLQCMEDLGRALIDHYPVEEECKSFYAPDGEYSAFGRLYEMIMDCPPLREPDSVENGFTFPNKIFEKSWEEKFGLIPVRNPTKLSAATYLSWIEEQSEAVTLHVTDFTPMRDGNFSSPIGPIGPELFGKLLSRIAKENLRSGEERELIHMYVEQKALRDEPLAERFITRLNQGSNPSLRLLFPLTKRKKGKQKGFDPTLLDRLPAKQYDPWDHTTWPGREYIMYVFLHDLMDLAHAGPIRMVTEL